jgi:hypothetical protein
MNNIRRAVKQLIRQGKQVDVTAKVKECEGTGEYYLPDNELEKIVKRFPGFERAGTDYQKIGGKKVWLPYYLTKGFFTANKDMLLPIKVNPIFPKKK